MDVNFTAGAKGNTSDAWLCQRQTCLSRDLLISVIVIVNVVSVLANVTVIIAIACIDKLRKSLSFVYIFSLCLLDLVAAISVVPKSISVIIVGGWEWDEYWCMANGYFNAFLTFAVILSICAIDLEKYYCIRFPMHHAGHMSVVSAVVSVGISWAIAILLAAVPLSFGGFAYHPQAMQCTYLWQRQTQNLIFGTFTAFLVLLLTTLLMLYINCSMYNIAKRAMRQIQPMFEVDNKSARPPVRMSIFVTGARGESSTSRQDSPEMTTSTMAMSSKSRNNSAIAADDRPKTDRASITSDTRFNIHREAITRIQRLQKVPERASIDDVTAQRRRLGGPRTNYKALKNLTIPSLYFLLVWGSISLVHLSWILETLPYSDTAQTFCTLLAYVSYALNPFVFGFLNKTFRDECISVFKEKVCGSRDLQPMRALPQPEDFMQFLAQSSNS